MKTNRDRIMWITRTAVLIALLIALQWATAGTAAFAKQYITGSCVNAVLAVAALTSGLLSGIVVALLSPFCAFLLGIGPQLIQIVPMIALGNVVFVTCLYFLAGKNKPVIWKQGIGLVIAAAAKFATLYLGVVKVLIPLLGDSLTPQQVKAFTAMFSYPQLITALIGGCVALAITPVIRKAIKR